MAKRNQIVFDQTPQRNAVPTLFRSLFYIAFGLTFLIPGTYFMLIALGVIHIAPEWLAINKHVSFPLLLVFMPGGVCVSGGLLSILEVLEIPGRRQLQKICTIAMGVSVLVPPLIWLVAGTNGILDSASRMIMGVIFAGFTLYFVLSIGVSLVPGLSERLGID